MSSTPASFEDLYARLYSWVQIDSTTGREADFLSVLEAYAKEVGYVCERQHVAENRWNLVIRSTASPRVLFSTHVDCVPPFLNARRDDERVWGRGACDTKGGIVAMLAAGDRLRRDGLDEFGYLFVVGEEVDHVGAITAAKLDLEPEQIILCEPTLNRLVRAQKGMVKMVFTAEGRAAHSAYPERGESAVHSLLDVLSRLRAHPWPADDVLGETTLNIGMISGGVAANVFAPLARAEVLVRTVADTSQYVEAIKAMLPSAVGVEFPAKNDPVFFDVPGDLPGCTVSFNTDAAYLAGLGPVWLVGPGDIQIAHSIDEHISYEQLRDGVDLYEDLARRILAGSV